MHLAVSQAPNETADRGPHRRCIASGAVRPKSELLRFVVGPDGTLVADPSGRLPGRGLWLSPRRDMLEKACLRNLFAKSAKASVRLPDDLLASTEAALRRRFLELLGLANRSGQTIAGFQKVRDRLSAGGAALLIQAGDAAEDGRRKIAAAARARQPDLPTVTLLTAAELGQAIGRDHVVHLLVLPGGLADRLRTEARRLEGLAGETGTLSRESSLS